MTDKEKLHQILSSLWKNDDSIGKTYYNKALQDVQTAIDLQEEPVKDRLIFKAIPRLLDMIEPSERAKSYVTKLADAFDSEGYSTDAKIVRESLKIMNGEKVPMATMDEEPVSEDLEEASETISLELYPKNIKTYCGPLPGGEPFEVDDNILPRQGFVRGFKAGAQWQKTKIGDIVKQYSDKGNKNYQDSYVNDGECSTSTCYLDGYRDCANEINRELED